MGTHAGGECGWLFHFQMYSSRVKTEKHIYWLVLPFASGDNMKKVFHNAIKTQISSLTDNNFQNFIDELYSKIYGSEYISIKQKRDKGCDGIIINEKKILSVYSPEKYNINHFKSKLTKDFKSYKDNWATNNPYWSVVYNGKITSDRLLFLQNLKSDVDYVGIDKIMGKINQLTHTGQREIAYYLGVDNDYFVYNIFEVIVEDMLNDELIIEGDVSYHDSPSYIQDKIDLNYSRDDVDAAIGEYHECLTRFQKLQAVLQAYEENALSTLKLKLRRDYVKYNGGFKERLQSMTEEYSKNYLSDDEYINNVRVVLIYLFEQCMIGEKTREEKNVKASSRK